MSISDITYWALFVIAAVAVIIAAVAIVRGPRIPEPVPVEPVADPWDFPTPPSVALFDQAVELARLQWPVSGAHKMAFAVILPPPEFYVNVPAQDHVFHLHEIDDDARPWETM